MDILNPGVSVVTTVGLAAQGFAVFNSAIPVVMLAAAVGNAGTYRISAYLVVSTTFVTNTTEVINIAYTDDQGLRGIQILPGTGVVLAAGSNGSGSIIIRSTGATAITYAPGVSGSAATAGAAAFSVLLERLI